MGSYKKAVYLCRALIRSRPYLKPSLIHDSKLRTGQELHRNQQKTLPEFVLNHGD